MSNEYEEEPLVILLEDLLPDDRGEVVLLTEESVPVSIITEKAVAQSGVAEDHVTASGLDVNGLNFYSFDNGITLYSAHDLLITDAAG